MKIILEVDSTSQHDTALLRAMTDAVHSLPAPKTAAPSANGAVKTTPKQEPAKTEAPAPQTHPATDGTKRITIEDCKNITLKKESAGIRATLEELGHKGPDGKYKVSYLPDDQEVLASFMSKAEALKDK